MVSERPRELAGHHLLAAGGPPAPQRVLPESSAPTCFLEPTFPASREHVMGGAWCGWRQAQLGPAEVDRLVAQGLLRGPTSRHAAREEGWRGFSLSTPYMPGGGGGGGAQGATDGERRAHSSECGLSAAPASFRCRLRHNVAVMVWHAGALGAAGEVARGPAAKEAASGLWLAQLETGVLAQVRSSGGGGSGGRRGKAALAHTAPRSCSSRMHHPSIRGSRPHAIAEFACSRLCNPLLRAPDTLLLCM